LRGRNRRAHLPQVVEFLQAVLGVAVVTFSVCTMAGVGLGHTLRDVFEPMLDGRAVFRALVANFILVPLLAYGVVRALSLEPAYATGLMLVATAAGAPLLIKLTATAGGSVALGASLTLLLLPCTVLYMPLVVPRVVPDARASPAAIALPLLWTMLLPLVAGLIVRARRVALAERLRLGSGRIANLALLVLIVATVGGNASGILRIIDRGAILAPFIVVLGAFAIGWAFGREHRGGHVVLGLGTAQRNVAAAMVVASQGLQEREVVVMVVVASLVELAILFPMAMFLARRSRRRVLTDDGASAGGPARRRSLPDVDPRPPVRDPPGAAPPGAP
jgi:BASS family bile acid:Na+ symporter